MDIYHTKYQAVINLMQICIHKTSCKEPVTPTMMTGPKEPLTSVNTNQPHLHGFTPATTCAPRIGSTILSSTLHDFTENLSTHRNQWNRHNPNMFFTSLLPHARTSGLKYSAHNWNMEAIFHQWYWWTGARYVQLYRIKENNVCYPTRVPTQWQKSNILTSIMELAPRKWRITVRA